MERSKKQMARDRAEAIGGYSSATREDVEVALETASSCLDGGLADPELMATAIRIAYAYVHDPRRPGV